MHLSKPVSDCLSFPMSLFALLTDWLTDRTYIRVYIYRLEWFAFSSWFQKNLDLCISTLHGPRSQNSSIPRHLTGVIFLFVIILDLFFWCILLHCVVYKLARHCCTILFHYTLCSAVLSFHFLQLLHSKTLFTTLICFDLNICSLI